MRHEKKDRRTRRSRQLLQKALLELLKKRRFEDISVQDIIERADVARSTFYVHYTDKEDLLVGKQGIFAASLDNEFGDEHHTDAKSVTTFPSQIWFVHIKAQAHIFKLIGKDSAMDLAMKTLRVIIREDIQREAEWHLLDEHPAALPTSLLIDYVTDALMSLIKWWIAAGMNLSAAKMDEMFQQLIWSGLPASIHAGTGQRTIN